MTFSNLDLLVREETEADVGPIRDLTVAAFASMEISSHTEQFIIEGLRAAGALTISLVAELHGQVVGHIAFSPVQLSDGSEGWYGLGPVSVLPEFQRKGIGKALIDAGLSRLKGLKAQGCCLVGHPQYYTKFGFRNVPGLIFEGVPKEVFFALSFRGPIPQGKVTFHSAFKLDA
jgi:putative acetyltransferase